MTIRTQSNRSALPDVRTRTEVIAREPAEALAALLDLPPLVEDGELPPLWHWIYLMERAAQRDLGPDGHPVNGIPAPPGAGRRRMFGGGRVTTYAPLRLGRPATRDTRVLRSTEKASRSGPLTLVTVRSEFAQDGRIAIVEEQDIVYREPGSPPAEDGTPPAPGAGISATRSGSRLEVGVDSTLLFRFSALTFNAHRIHYDRAYAEYEGYNGLVVHGPLQALLMGELLRRSGLAIADHTFAYRLVAPLVGEQRITVEMDDSVTGPVVRVRDGRGTVTATGALRVIDP
jgi:3-methylfumaryl-CoA hydratase